MAKAAEYMARRQQQDADMSQDWPIHRGFLIYTLEDVAHENSKETLMQWHKLFNPSAQPRSEEEFFYVRHMASAIQNKLDMLANKCT